MKYQEFSLNTSDSSGKGYTETMNQSWAKDSDQLDWPAPHRRRPSDEGDKRRLFAVLLLIAMSGVCVVSAMAGEELPIPSQPSWNILGHLLIISLATSQMHRANAGNKRLAIGLLCCFLSGAAGITLNLPVATQLPHSLYFALQDVTSALAAGSAVAVGLSAAGAERLHGRVRAAVYIMAWLVIACVALTLIRMYTSVILLGSFWGICLDSTPIAVGGCLLLFACLDGARLLGVTR